MCLCLCLCSCVWETACGLGACLRPCICVCKHEASAYEKQREKLQIKANPYLSDSEPSKPTRLLFPTGGWGPLVDFTREAESVRFVSDTEKVAGKQLRVACPCTCGPTSPRSPGLGLAFSHHHELPSSGLPLPFQPILTPPLNFPGLRQAPKAYHQVPQGTGPQADTWSWGGVRAVEEEGARGEQDSSCPGGGRGSVQTQVPTVRSWMRELQDGQLWC